MSRSGVVGAAAVATAVGLLIALLATDASLIAFEVWVGAALVCLAAILTQRLLRANPGFETTWRPLWRRHRPETTLPPRPALLAAGDRVVAGSLRQPRLFDTRLRPRLVALLDDADIDPEQLGSARWLADSTVVDRTPTLDELTLVFDLLENRP